MDIKLNLPAIWRGRSGEAKGNSLLWLHAQVYLRHRHALDVSVRPLDLDPEITARSTPISLFAANGEPPV